MKSTPNRPPETTAPATAAGRPRSGVIVPLQPRWHGRLAAWLIWFLVSLLARTIRWKVEDRSGCFGLDQTQPVIFAIWHNRLALAMTLHRKVICRHQPNRRAAGLVSASRDGGLLARILELYGVRPIRGSSSRRGGPALRELIQSARQGYDLAITPDGPKGPAYVMQPGVIALAQLTGLPIVPVGYWLGWKKTLGSWDRFQVPLPFTRCHVIVDAPIRVPSTATEADREQLRLAVTRRLQEITQD